MFFIKFYFSKQSFRTTYKTNSNNKDKDACNNSDCNDNNDRIFGTCNDRHNYSWCCRTFVICISIYKVLDKLFPILSYISSIGILLYKKRKRLSYDKVLHILHIV